MAYHEPECLDLDTLLDAGLSNCAPALSGETLTALRLLQSMICFDQARVVARVNTDIVLPPSTTTILPFDLEEIDVHNDYNPLSGYFLAPFDGIYHFTGYVTWQTNDVLDRLGLEIVKGSDVISAAEWLGTDLYTTQLSSFCATFRAVAGDLVFIRATYTSADDPFTIASRVVEPSRLEIELISK